MITQERLKELLEYDPETGKFTRRVPLNGHRAGETCGTVHFEGYIAIKVDGRSYMAHRLAWLYVHGEWPAKEIDHVNRNRSDNRWRNLREASRAENQQNRCVRKDSKSGYPGVTWDKASKKWRARISHGGRQYFLGHFDDPVKAAAAYRDAKSALHTFNPQVPS